MCHSGAQKDKVPKTPYPRFWALAGWRGSVRTQDSLVGVVPTTPWLHYKDLQYQSDWVHLYSENSWLLIPTACSCTQNIAYFVISGQTCWMQASERFLSNKMSLGKEHLKDFNGAFPKETEELSSPCCSKLQECRYNCASMLVMLKTALLAKKINHYWCTNVCHTPYLTFCLILHHKKTT